MEVLPPSPSPIRPVEIDDSTNAPSRSSPKTEIRLSGLEPHHTAPALVAFFSQITRVIGVLLHPSPDGKQWAQIWVGGEEEARRCMKARAQLEASGLTIILPSALAGPTPSQAPLLPRFEYDTAPMTVTRPDLLNMGDRYQYTTSVRPNLHDQDMFDLPAHYLPYNADRALALKRDDFTGVGYRREPAGSLPRNLYIVDLPLHMTEAHFKAMFERHGCVEHCKLLSQLDGNGRRRGFILMKSHDEALEAMRCMNGLYMEIDISWALVQREARHFGTGIGAMPNRVMHPPIHPIRHEATQSTASASVIAEGLDPHSFPSESVIIELFSTFGSIKIATIIGSTPEFGLTALLEFESPFSAELLVQASGMVIGSKMIYVRHIQQQPTRHQSNLQAQLYPDFRQQESDTLYQPQQARGWLNRATPRLQPFTHSSNQQLQMAFEPFSPSPTTHVHLGGNASDNQSRLNASVTPFVPVCGMQVLPKLPQSQVQSKRLQYPQTPADECHNAANPKTPSPPPLFDSTLLRGQTQPTSSPLTGHSSDTIVSPTSSGKSAQHAGQPIEAKRFLPAASSGCSISIGMTGAPSKMHDRWLKAVMGDAGDNKWKSTTWCELGHLLVQSQG